MDCYCDNYNSTVEFGILIKEIVDAVVSFRKL